MGEQSTQDEVAATACQQGAGTRKAIPMKAYDRPITGGQKSQPAEREDGEMTTAVGSSVD